MKDQNESMTRRPNIMPNRPGRSSPRQTQALRRKGSLGVGTNGMFLPVFRPRTVAIGVTPAEVLARETAAARRRFDEMRRNQREAPFFASTIKGDLKIRNPGFLYSRPIKARTAPFRRPRTPRFSPTSHGAWEISRNSRASPSDSDGDGDDDPPPPSQTGSGSGSGAVS